VTSTTLRFFRISSFGTETGISDTTAVNGFWGAAGTSNTSVIGRYNSINNALTVTDTAQVSGNLQVFARSGADFTDARLSYYSIGESLNLALLDARITALINAIAASIP
jgi:phospholipase/lecithinase/hemolysin